MQNKSKKKKVCCICWLGIIPLLLIIAAFTALIFLKMQESELDLSAAIASISDDGSATLAPTTETTTDATEE